SASAPEHRSSRLTAPAPRAATANQELSKRRPANDRSGSPSPAALIFRADLHIGARRVFDRFELAVAGLAGRDLAAGVSRYPPLPDRPPRIRALRRAGEPLLGGRRIALVLPMAVFAAARRIDDTGDMAGGRQHELDRPRIELRRGVGRAPRRDGVLAGRQQKS